MHEITVNTRSAAAQLTGVQRYTLELLARIKDFGTICPTQPMHGMKGHLWEQMVLPARLGGSLLWSPANTGPLAMARQVLTIHDMTSFDHPEWMGKKFGQWYRFLTPRLARRVQHIITVSEFTRQRIIAHCPVDPDKVSVVHNGVDAAFRPMDRDSIRAVQSRLQLPSARYVLALGSVEPRKNVFRLLKAWSEIQSSLPEDIWLVIAGGKGGKRIFGEAAGFELPPRVHLTGHVPDDALPALYSGALCSAYVSLYEGFGLPVLESMASGTPTLASATTSLPEVGGDAVLTVDPYSVEEIGRGIKTLLGNADLREQFRSLGLARSKIFSWDRAATVTRGILMKEAQL